MNSSINSFTSCTFPNDFIFIKFAHDPRRFINAPNQPSCDRPRASQREHEAVSTRQRDIINGQL